MSLKMPKFTLQKSSKNEYSALFIAAASVATRW